jgi:hypothetical protein
MKSLINAVALALVLAAPVASFAQSSQPETRAQVRAELVQLEKAGYRPSADKITYPAGIQAAEARVAAENGPAQTASADVGGVTSGASQAGRPAIVGLKSIYFGQ